MKKIFYGILPALAILVILINMLYGHMLFVSASDQAVNKYEIYVHLEPDWNLHQKNILFEITNSWNKDSDQNTMESKIRDHNYNEVQNIGDKSYVELKHSFSNCQDEWHPMLYRKAVDSVRQEVEVLQGKQLQSDSTLPMYSNFENESYDEVEQQQKIKEGFSQFIPICTKNEITSYDYSVKIDSDSLGFDVYFVSSVDKRDDFHNPETDFDFYYSVGCYANNKKSFTGTCNDVGKNSGLLVIVPTSLDKPLTKVFVTLKEREI